MTTLPACLDRALLDDIFATHRTHAISARRQALRSRHRPSPPRLGRPGRRLGIGRAEFPGATHAQVRPRRNDPTAALRSPSPSSYRAAVSVVRRARRVGRCRHVTPTWLHLPAGCSPCLDRGARRDPPPRSAGIACERRFLVGKKSIEVDESHSLWVYSRFTTEGAKRSPSRRSGAPAGSCPIACAFIGRLAVARREAAARGRGRRLATAGPGEACSTAWSDHCCPSRLDSPPAGRTWSPSGCWPAR